MITKSYNFNINTNYSLKIEGTVSQGPQIYQNCWLSDAKKQFSLIKISWFNPPLLLEKD